MNRRASACDLARRNGARYLGTSTAGVSRPPFADRLALWLDLTSPDTSIVSGAVAQIGDRSGNAYHFPQGVDTKRPAYTASDPDFGGRPSMSFDGVDDCLRRTALPAWPQQTVCIVAHGGTATRRLMNNTGTGGEILVQNDSATALRTVYFNAGTTAKPFTKVSGATYRVIGTFDSSVGASALSEVWLDGVDTGVAYSTTTAVNGPMSGSRTMAIGSNAAGTSAFFDDKIAEVLVYSDDLSDAEIAIFDAWLAARYSL